MWKRWKSTSAYCGTPQRIGHDRTAIESRYLHNLAASNSWTVSVAEERKFRREECMAKCSLSCVIYCTRMRQAARLKLCIAWIASLIIHQHFATLIHVLQICKLSTKNADLWNDSTPLLKVDLPRLLFLRRGVPLERCPDNDGQLLIKKSPKDVQRHWCFQCHVFTPNEQIVIHDDEKNNTCKDSCKMSQQHAFGAKDCKNDVVSWRDRWWVCFKVTMWTPPVAFPWQSLGLTRSSQVACWFMDLLQIPVALATAHLGPEEARKQVQTPARATSCIWSNQNVPQIMDNISRKIKCVSVFLTHVFFTLCFQKVISGRKRCLGNEKKSLGLSKTYEIHTPLAGLRM